jgi:hypothetical protein
MSSEGLNPGDRVVELAGLVISAAVATGAVAGAWLLWLIKKSWLMSTGGFVAGAAVGFGAGHLMARILYRTGGNTTVVKVGAASLASTIPAGLAGGIVTAITLGVLVVLIFNARNQALSLFGTAVACGVIIGVLWACLGSLL